MTSPLSGLYPSDIMLGRRSQARMDKDHVLLLDEVFRTGQLAGTGSRLVVARVEGEGMEMTARGHRVSA